MHEANLIQDLAVIMMVAGVTTVLFHYLKQPVVLGYILAGVLIGPHTPPIAFISNEHTIKTLGELGVIFLMLSLGLEFNLTQLRKVGWSATTTALIEIIVMLFVGYTLGILFKWDTMDAIFLGGILSISSTTIIVKVLKEHHLQREKFAQLIFGILIIEDILAIGLLALLSSLATTGGIDFLEITTAISKLFIFLIISVLIGILTVPRLLAFVATFHNHEVLLITVLGLCFMFCLIAIKFHYSVALGAFIIGTVIAESKHLETIEYLIKPIRNMFSAIFFVSVGLLFDPRIFMHYFYPIIIITIALILGKIVSCSIGAFITGSDGKNSLRVGMGLAQIGEFSFIIAALGNALDVTSDYLYSIVVVVSVITTFTTPLLIKSADYVSSFIQHKMPNRLVETFSLYTGWLENISPSSHQIELRQLMRRNLSHVLINFVIVLTIYLTGAYILRSGVLDYMITIHDINIKKMYIWGASLIFSLPFLIAIYRRLNRLSLILSEFGVKEDMMGGFTMPVRKIISQVIPILALIGILLLVSLSTISIMPSYKLLIIILSIGFILTAVLWRWLIRLHSKLHVALLENLDKKK